MVKKVWWYVYSFWRDPRTWQTHGQTDRQTPQDDIGCACIASRGKNCDKNSRALFFSWTQCILLHRVCRPWYAFAATYPKDLVIMIDNSRSMTSTFDKHSRLYYAIKAAQWVIDTLNPYDHVSMQCSLSIFSQLRETLTCLMNPLFSICVLKALSYYSTWCSR